jgi:hypothetical protein
VRFKRRRRPVGCGGVLTEPNAGLCSSAIWSRGGMRSARSGPTLKRFHWRHRWPPSPPVCARDRPALTSPQGRAPAHPRLRTACSESIQRHECGMRAHAAHTTADTMGRSGLTMDRRAMELVERRACARACARARVGVPNLLGAQRENETPERARLVRAIPANLMAAHKHAPWHASMQHAMWHASCHVARCSARTNHTLPTCAEGGSHRMLQHGRFAMACCITEGVACCMPTRT